MKFLFVFVKLYCLFAEGVVTTNNVLLLQFFFKLFITCLNKLLFNQNKRYGTKTDMSLYKLTDFTFGNCSISCRYYAHLHSTLIYY